MSSLRHESFQKIKCFEDLPDEILLLICRYLSQINILDSLLNLNDRLNTTITSYRERIHLSHLSYKDFNKLMNIHLPYLAENVNCLYINTCSMLNAGKIFEEKFKRIDQQFPRLRKIIFHQIDIETLENLSWRFNTMTFLNQLSIDITEDRLTSMPIQFDEFICGKLFSSSNSFEVLRLHLHKYKFSLHSITTVCMNIRHLTISVKCFNDLLVVFNYLPNIEKLKITVGCSSPYDLDNDKYLYERLWWKVPYLTSFDFTMKEEQLSSHGNVVSSDTIIKIIKNLHSLLHFKFVMNIGFNSELQVTTTKDIYVNKYLPYADGSLWQEALQRSDSHIVNFELHIELDGITTNDRSKTFPEFHGNATYRNDGNMSDFDFFRCWRSPNNKFYWLLFQFTVKMKLRLIY